MKPMRESAGGVVLGPEEKIVLVCQFGNSWSFPKGGIEKGESALEAAQREIQEETGLAELTLLRPLGSYRRYSIGKDGIGENKEWGLCKRTLFLFRTPESTLAPQDDEVTEALWFTMEEALTRLTHPKDREFLLSVRYTIES